MATQRVKNRSAVIPANIPSKHYQKIEECFASNDHNVTVRQLIYTTDLNAQSKTYSRSKPLDESPTQEEASHKIYLAPIQRYQIDKSSLRTRKRAWQDEHDEQDDLNRVLDEERQAWSKKSHKDLRKQYNTGQSEQLLEGKYEKNANTCAASDREETSGHIHHQRRSNFVEGSMTEGSRGTASTWQGPSFEEPSTPKTGMDENSDLDATPKPYDLDQTSTRSSFDINDFKPLPPTPSTLASTLKRFGQRFKAIETKQDSPQISTCDAKTLRNPKKGLRKSLSSWKIFSSSTSEMSDVESDCTDDFRPDSILRDKDTHSNSHQSILDERKRKAEIAYAEQFGTSKKRQKDSLGHSRIPGDQTCSDTEQVTIRKRSAMSISNLKAISSTARSDKPGAGAGNLHIPLDTFSKQHCTQGQPDSTSRLPPLPRESSLSFDSDIDRKKRRRRSYSALEKENQYLRQQLRASEGREATKRDSNIPKISSNNITSSSTLLSSMASDKARGDLEGQLQGVDGQSTTASSSHQHSTESHNIRHTPSSQYKATRKSPGIEASELSQIIRETLPMPSPVRMPSTQNILYPLSLNASYSRDSATIKHRPLGSSNKKDNTFEIPRSLSMVLEGIEEDENGETGENIGTSTVTNSGITGRRKLGQIIESEPRKAEGKWEWPEDVF